MDLRPEQTAAIRRHLENLWADQQARLATCEAEIYGKQALLNAVGDTERPSLRYFKTTPRQKGAVTSQRDQIEHRITELEWEAEMIRATIAGLEAKMDDFPDTPDEEAPGDVPSGVLAAEANPDAVDDSEE